MANTYGKVSGTFQEIENAYGKVSGLGKKLMRYMAQELLKLLLL
jgi:hypothetical protein